MGRKGQPLSEEARKNISIAQKLRFAKNPVWNKGIPQSLEAKEKNRIAHLGKLPAITGKKHTEESLLKMRGRKCSEEEIKRRKGLVGEKSSRYIKDRTKLKKSENRKLNVAYIDWSKRVKVRDEYKCKLSCEECKGRLESHHILSWREYPEERYNIDNGITLCSFHHPRKYKEEKELASQFKVLVSQ